MKAIIFIILLGPVIHIFGQKDSSETIKKKEQELDYLSEKFKERSSMLFIAGRASVEYPDFHVYDNGVYAGYERKLAKTHVVGGGAGFFLDFGNSNSANHDYLLKFNLNYKFLYNLDYRMKTGKTGNNFSANYFCFSPTLVYRIEPYLTSGYNWDFTQGTWAVKYKRETSLALNLKMGYGIQRLIRDRILFDINAGIVVAKGYSNSSLGLQGNLYGQVTVGFIIK